MRTPILARSGFSLCGGFVSSAQGLSIRLKPLKLPRNGEHASTLFSRTRSARSANCGCPRTAPTRTLRLAERCGMRQPRARSAFQSAEQNSPRQ